MPCANRESERFRSLEAAFANLTKREIVELVQRSEFGWIMGTPARPGDKTARMELSEACAKQHWPEPQYEHRNEGPADAPTQYVRAILQVNRGATRAQLLTKEYGARRKKAAAEEAARDLLGQVQEFLRPW